VSDSDNPNIASKAEQFQMGRSPVARDAPPEGPPELLQPTYPPDILPMYVAKAYGAATHPVDDPSSSYPDPPPPPSDTASGQEPTEPAAPGPPVNVDVPYVEQSGGVLTCTMGNWTGEPDAYNYRWTVDGAEAGGNDDILSITGDDIGKTAVCVVTATNGEGSTTAPASNEVVITAMT
jgi:hypothetical protein